MYILHYVFFINYPFSKGNVIIDIQSKKIYAILYNSNKINFGKQLGFLNVSNLTKHWSNVYIPHKKIKRHPRLIHVTSSILLDLGRHSPCFWTFFYDAVHNLIDNLKKYNKNCCTSHPHAQYVLFLMWSGGNCITSYRHREKCSIVSIVNQL